MTFAKPFKVTIESLSSDGEGVFHHQGRKYAVPGTIPDEEVVLSLGARKSPQLLEIKSPSHDRNSPLCPHFFQCGGCQIQHMNYSRQLFEKQKYFVDILKPSIHTEVVLPILPSPHPFHYRSRVQLHVGPHGEIGFFAPHRQKVIAIDQCFIAHPDLNRRLPEVRQMAKEILQKRNRPTFLRIELTQNDAGQVEIEVNPEERDFLQINPSANVILQKLLGETFRRICPRRVVELYAGEGNLTFALYQLGQEWDAVEFNQLGVKKGQQRALKLGLPIHWHEEDAALFLKSRKGTDFDLLLLDPPRSGAAQALKELPELKIPRVIYVSCFPPTLARDLKFLGEIGYEIEWVRPIDFFPQTMHVEAVTSLSLVR